MRFFLLSRISVRGKVRGGWGDTKVPVQLKRWGRVVSLFHTVNGSGLAPVWLRSGSGLAPVWLRSGSGAAPVRLRGGSGAAVEHQPGRTAFPSLPSFPFPSLPLFPSPSLAVFAGSAWHGMPSRCICLPCTVWLSLALSGALWRYDRV